MIPLHAFHSLYFALFVIITHGQVFLLTLIILLQLLLKYETSLVFL